MNTIVGVIEILIGLMFVATGGAALALGVNNVSKPAPAMEREAKKTAAFGTSAASKLQWSTSSDVMTGWLWRGDRWVGLLRGKEVPDYQMPGPPPAPPPKP
jgi:hypothetical protein